MRTRNFHENKFKIFLVSPPSKLFVITNMKQFNSQFAPGLRKISIKVNEVTLKVQGHLKVNFSFLQ